MNLMVRTETPTDHPAVFELITQAFAQEAYSDQQEQFLVERLRRSSAFFPNLSIVAESDGQVVGHILLTAISVMDGPSEHPSLALAPVSVLPSHQGQGIGTALIEEAHRRAEAEGHRSIILVGHEHYYPRFGYQPAHQFGIHFPFDVPPENGMIKALSADALTGIQGKVIYPPAFFGTDE